MTSDPRDQPGVMTRQETARALGISPRVLSDKIAAGLVPLVPCAWSGYRTLFLRADVERVLSGQRRPVVARRTVNTHEAA